MGLCFTPRRMQKTEVLRIEVELNKLLEVRTEEIEFKKASGA